MKNENEKKVLTDEEMNFVTGGGDETPVPDDLSEQNKGQPERRDRPSLPDGNVIT